MKNIILILLSFVSFFVFSQDASGDPNRNADKNGWDYYAEGNYRESLRALEIERKYFPNRINIYVIAAWNYRELKEFPNMEMISLEGLKYQPNDPRILRNLGEAYYFQRKYSDAIAAFESYLKYKYQPRTDSFLPFIYYYLGVSYFNINQFRKSDICFSYSKYYSANNFQTLLYLAECKEKLEEDEKAYKLYEESLKLKPNNVKGLEGVNRLKNKIKQ